MPSFLRQLLSVLVALGAALVTLPVQSQYTSDIDIYGTPPTSQDAPNVLFVLDNTANWSSAFTSEIAALVASFNGLSNNQFRVGIMMFTESGGGNSGPDGGYVRSSIRLLDSTYRPVAANLLNSLNVNSDKSNGGKTGLTMAEAYYYFSGKAPMSGSNKVKTDYTGNVFGTTQSQAVYGLPGNALGSIGGSPYISPVVSSCARNYIIYISNGAVQENSADTSSASSALTAAYTALGMTRPADITGLSPNGSQSNVADEWARFMKASPQAISTYTVDVNPSSTGQGSGWSALLKSIAGQSGGEYFAVNSSTGGAEISSAIAQIFNHIQAVNSVFSSASLPVSVNARGTYLNQVFMGMFRPNGDNHPRWRGNLKQFQFGYDPATDTLSLVDAAGSPAVSGATGFISPTAKSFWTHTSTFWINQMLGTPATGSDAPDGEVVEKGGIAQGIRDAYGASQTARKIYTCIGCAANTNLATSAATQFVTSTSALTTSLLSVTTTSARDNLINWVRGADNAGDESGPGGTVTVRPSVHGDVLHSRPAVINYGTATGVVVFYGANDGLLRAVNGNQTGAFAGQELWGFLPEEHLGKLARQRSNQPDIRLSVTAMPATVTAASPSPKDYFADGPIGVYQKIATGGVTERVIVYSAMRRGGRVLYALDVTDPQQPVFLWKRTSADLPVLGQTWSEPKVARLRGNANPVIIMGAGYDNLAEDAPTPGTTAMGNAVLVLDAFSGVTIKQFATDRSVPADVALVDSDYDGYVDRAYAVDTGGNVYRVEFETATTSTVANWSIYKLASLTGAGTRKFFYPPDVVLSKNFSALLVGSGDREKPLAGASSDAFFTVYDTRTAKGTPTGGFTPITPRSLGQVGTAQDKTAGCFIPMSTAGEKIVNAPVTVGGVTYFSTNAPSPSTPGSCSANLGVAKVYSAPLFCQVAASQALIGGGLAPSPVTGVVTVNYTIPGTNQSASKLVPFIIGAPNSKQSGIEGSKVTPTIAPTRKRRYWYLENSR